MANFDSSKSNFPSDISPNIGALPYVEIDQSTLSFGRSVIQGYGDIYNDGIAYRTQFTFYGSFSYSSQTALENSLITGANLVNPQGGSFLISGLSLRFGSFLADPNTVGRTLLAADDIITGSRFGETIEPYLGDDIVYAGDGDDRLVGGNGVDRMFGEGGSDIFIIRQNAGPTWIKNKSKFLPKNGFPLDSTRKGKKGKIKSLLIDRDYINCPDFNISQDVIGYEGISPDAVTVQDMSLYVAQGGIGFFAGDSQNLLAYFPNISISQYNASGGMFEI